MSSADPFLSSRASIRSSISAIATYASASVGDLASSTLESALCSNAVPPEPPLERKVHPIELVGNIDRKGVLVEKPEIRQVKSQWDLCDVNSEQKLSVAGR